MSGGKKTRIEEGSRCICMVMMDVHLPIEEGTSREGCGLIIQVQQRSQTGTNHQFEMMEIQTVVDVVDSDDHVFLVEYPSSTYHALILSSAESVDDHDDDDDGEATGPVYRVALFAEFVTNGHYYDDGVFEWIFDNTKRNLLLDGIKKKFQDRKVAVEGVTIVDDLLASRFRSSLDTAISALARKQEKEGLADYHPHSNNSVRDIVHPALYSYVDKITPLRKELKDAPEPKPIKRRDLLYIGGSSDFFDRRFESSKYQWLPTYFKVSPDGQCSIEDYINNLTPRNHPVIRPLYDHLARLFEQCLPYIESVYSYVRALQSALEMNYYCEYYWITHVDPLEMNSYSLRGQSLQVISKIVDYELLPGEKCEGVWHSDGMSHEQIVLTALYILDRDEEIDGGDLLFKRAMLSEEINTIFSLCGEFTPTPVEDMIQEDFVPLGRVETRKGRLIVFPNSHFHRVDSMINKAINGEGADILKPSTKKKAKEDTATSTTNGSEKRNFAKRRIVVFFLVDPLKRVISTREVAPQSGPDGTMNRDDALAHRLELMEERNRYNQHWKVCHGSLYEH